MEGKRSWLRLALMGASLALFTLAFAGPVFASGPYLRDLVADASRPGHVVLGR